MDASSSPELGRVDEASNGDTSGPVVDEPVKAIVDRDAGDGEGKEPDNEVEAKGNPFDSGSCTVTAVVAVEVIGDGHPFRSNEDVDAFRFR